MTVTQVDSKELCVKCTLIETEWRDESGDPVCALCQDDDAMRKRAEAAEARAAQAEQERNDLRRQLEQAQQDADQRLEMLYSMRGFLYGCGYTGAAIEAYLSELDKKI